MLSSCIALLPACHKCIPKLSCQHALSHVSSVVVICVAIHLTHSEIHNDSQQRHSSIVNLSTTTTSRSKGKQFDPKLIPTFFTSSCSSYSSQPFIPFVTQSPFVSNYFWWKSASFSSPGKLSTRPPAAFPSPMQAKPLTCHWQVGVTNLFQPCCYIVAATLLLLHCCCYIVAATSLLLRIRQKPISSGQPSHHTLSPDSQQGNAEKCNNLN